MSQGRHVEGAWGSKIRRMKWKQEMELDNSVSGVCWIFSMEKKANWHACVHVFVCMYMSVYMSVCVYERV